MNATENTQDYIWLMKPTCTYRWVFEIEGIMLDRGELVKSAARNGMNLSFKR